MAAQSFIVGAVSTFPQKIKAFLKIDGEVVKSGGYFSLGWNSVAPVLSQ
ncbi:hypothetical protein BGS_0226 [Beggiatoa sp. SS]|nr:hypothetical protein BGS_0226 [Beggiatoa sp. SS]